MYIQNIMMAHSQLEMQHTKYSKNKRGKVKVENPPAL
jgi:hypothetical protein